MKVLIKSLSLFIGLDNGDIKIITQEIWERRLMINDVAHLIIKS